MSNKPAAAKPAENTKIEEVLKKLAIDALEDLKAIDLKTLDVTDLSDVTDYMVICSGRSSRHIKSLANSIITKAKEAGYKPLGIEGEQSKEWVLVDLGEVVVHIMVPEARDLYNLEELWAKTEAMKTES